MTLSQLKAKGMNVRWIRCDNAGENLALQQLARSKDWQLNLDF